MQIDKFEKKINYIFKNKELIELAFTHSSFKKRKSENYERLEFLGDRVLSLVISENLFSKYPNENEGALSKRLSDLISKSKGNQTNAQPGIYFLIALPNEVSIDRMPVRKLFCRPQPFC